MSDEAKWIKRVLDGDDDAFSYLVEVYEDKVYRLCLRMCQDPEDARDLTQEAFVKAWRGLRFYRQEAAFSTWLYRLTGNVCLDFLRQKKRRPTVSLSSSDEEDVQWEVPDLAPTPEEQIMEYSAKQTVADAMALLEEEFRMILTLRVVEELSYEEIGHILDLKPGTVKSRLARAREKLKKILLQNGNNFWEESVKESRKEDA